MTRVLVVTHDTLGSQMAGPAIRCWELAKELAKVCRVTLTSKLPVDRDHPEFEVTSFLDRRDLLLEQASAADVLLVQGLMLNDYPELERLGKYLVVDVYDPFVFESYPHFDSLGPRRDEFYLLYTDILNRQLAVADFAICASNRQRDLWLGVLGALGRLTPDLVAQDPSLRQLIDIVPFGLSEESPGAGDQPVLRGVLPGIGADDTILVWGGGIWNWFDPLTVIRAVAELDRDDVKLYFPGVRHPNPEIPEMEMTARAMALAEELGVRDRLVFFNEAWVPYEERQRYLVEASAGISAHFDSIETRFSFRTRVLDYLWAGLPILTAEGDSMADLVRVEDLGTVVPVQDLEAWKAAITAIAADPAARAATSKRVNAVSCLFRWSEVARPLVAYCQAPYHTARLIERPIASLHRAYTSQARGMGGGKIDVWRLLALSLHAWGILRADGAGAVGKKAVRFLAKRAARRKAPV